MSTSSASLSSSGAARENALPRRDMAIIMTMLIATFVMILNETIMNVALPKLITVMQLTPATAQWLSTGYMLTMGVVIPVTGFLIQRVSTRRLFILALSLFSLGTLVAALAPGFEVLLAGRVLQASGTAIMLPLLFTVILALVPAERRGSIMGTLSIVISVAPAIGPTLSGVIIQSLSWRFLFLLVLPVALIVLLYGIRNLKNVGEPGKAALDIPSVVLSVLGFGGLVYGFSQASAGQWVSLGVLLPLAVALLSLIVFALRQLQLRAPLLDLRAFGYRIFSLSAVMLILSTVSLFSAFLLLPLYLQQVRGVSPLVTGLLLMPGGVLMGVASPFVGRLFDRYGPTALTASGATLMALALWRFTSLSATTPLMTILLLQILLMLALSLIFTPVMTNGLNQLPPALYSHGSAIISTLQQVGGAVGTALLVTVLTLVSRHSVQAGAAAGGAMTAGLHAAFFVSAGIAVLTLVLALFLRRVQPAPRPEGEAAFGH